MPNFLRSMTAAMAWALLASAMAQTPPATKPAGVYRNTPWEDLTPKDWDPMKEFREMRGSPLSDNDPRANSMLKRMREAWDSAPANPAMEGATIRIPGYLVPLEETKAGMKEFLLVPYFGACIHTPPPPANQIIHVLPKAPAPGLRSMDAVWVSGAMKLVRSDTSMGVSSYRMDAVLVEPYTAPSR
jgi:uncharacterized protein